MTYHKAESQAEIDDTTLPALDSPEESIPRSFVPWNRDDDRSRYLGFRASGFSIRETLGLLGKAKSTVSMWRRDPVFLELENSIPELRKTLALEYAGLEFLRNFRLVLEKDYRVLKDSLSQHTRTIMNKDGTMEVVNTGMEPQDFQYLLKARGFYSPQQLREIEQLFGRAADSDKEVNWTDVVLRMSRTTEELRVETRQRSEPVISRLDAGDDNG
ncbi:MAG: hypothetical protein M0R06_00245 [Sphaerochaeta sp.]|jgi:hypothetical protein|nr:hypothetical protein [Sphaerochaeta sp.]